MSYQYNRQHIWLPQPTPRLAIEHPTSSSNQVAMCDFHLRIDHDGVSFPEMARFMKMQLLKEKIEEYVALEDAI